MAEELVSTVGILATSMANCNVVRADANGLVILPEFPKTVGNITLGGGGYIPGQGIVIGEGNGTTQGDDVIIGSNITTTDGYNEGGNIAIGNKAEVKYGGIAIGSSYAKPGGTEYTTRANDAYSVAIGAGASALSWGSIALGYKAFSSNTSSTVLGTCAYASGQYSIALGYCACASGNYSTALGAHAFTSGNGSIALGPCACAKGDCSIALGDSAFASGYHSTALGVSSCSFGINSISIGPAKSEEGGIAISSKNSLDNPDFNSVEGNEILLYSENTCLYIGGNTSTVCRCHGCVSYLKVSKDGILTVNNKEMASKEDIVSQVNTMVTNATKVDTTDSNFTLTDVANALNTLIDLLKANQQA